MQQSIITESTAFKDAVASYEEVGDGKLYAYEGVRLSMIEGRTYMNISLRVHRRSKPVLSRCHKHAILKTYLSLSYTTSVTAIQMNEAGC